MKKFVSKALTSVFTMAMIMGVTTMVTTETASAKKVTVKKVSVTSPSGKTVYVAKKKKVKLSTTIKVTPNKKVTYKSANKKIATVTAKGVVKGIKPGTTKITVISKKNKKKKATIKVVVMKNATKKITLNTKEAELSPGGSTKLTATIAPKKKVSKKITWVSSNKKVATVSNQGVVKAIGVGKATITAKATDGSNKKAKCKVTVAHTVNLTKVTVLNDYSLSFCLDSPQALTLEQVLVSTKMYPNGFYTKPLTLHSITTTDNTNYTVTLDNNNPLCKNDYVQVSIPSLSGKMNQIETIYPLKVQTSTSEDISLWTIDEFGYCYVMANTTYGTSSFSVDSLPEGLYYEEYPTYIIIKGTPTKAGTYKTTIKTTDELGNTDTNTLYLCIPSDDTIVGATLDCYTLIDNSSTENNVEHMVLFGGGSYYYKLEIISDPQNSGLTLANDFANYAILKGSIKKPGTYPITVRAKDTENLQNYLDVSFTVTATQGLSVVGQVQDSNGNPIPNATVSFSNQDEQAPIIYTTEYTTDKDGVYTACLPSGTYDIIATYMDSDDYHNGTKGLQYLFNQSITENKLGLNIKLPLHKVTFTSSEEDVLSLLSENSLSWYCNGAPLGEAEQEILLKSGTYTVTSSLITDKTGEYTLTSTFTITDKDIQATITKAYRMIY